MPEIILKHITKRWGNTVAVNDLNMVIKDRGFVTLLGPSGCGKTTTLRMIAGLETPTEGEIIIDGKTVFDAAKGINISPAKRNIGFLFQNYALWPHMTVYKNIAFGLENLKWKKTDIIARVKELAGMLKIGGLLDRYPSELSGGQQQRVAIARTLAPKPSVLFMDEPLSNLDAKLRLEMRTELKRLHLDTNSTFVYVTHDQLEAMTLATEVCLMKEGVVQQYDPPLYVYSHPSNLFVADFVGNPAINFISATVKEKHGKELLLEFHDAAAKYTAQEDFEIEGDEVIIGVRPECIAVTKTTGLEATVFSTLPAGMETTLKINMKENILTSVVFGIIDYQMDEKVKINFTGDGISLFNSKTSERLALGQLKLLK